MWRYKHPSENFGGENENGKVDLAPKVLESNARPLEAEGIVELDDTIPSTTTVHFSG